MGKVKELSSDLKDVIINLALRGYSLRKIGQTVNKSHSTVQYIVNKFREEGSTQNVPRKPKERRLNKRDERFILKRVRENPRLSVPQLRPLVENVAGKMMSDQTVRRALWKHGYHGRIPRKRPYVNKVNRRNRLSFAKEHIHKDQEFWDSVIWSDESKINIYGSDGINRVWRKSNKDNDHINTVPTVKHGGGSLMIWGCMSSKGVGTIQFIDGIMDAYVYLDILKNDVKQSAQKWTCRLSTDSNKTMTVSIRRELT